MFYNYEQFIYMRGKALLVDENFVLRYYFKT